MLNSLVIKNFRMLEDFSVEKLGRLNLIVGKNNSGKSTVLEALRIYAGGANFNLLKEIAESHDEKFPLAEANDQESNVHFPYEELFTGRQPSNKKLVKFIIGESIDNQHTLSVYRVFIVQDDLMGKTLFSEFNEDWLNKKPQTRIIGQALVAEKPGKWHFIRQDIYHESPFELVNCSLVPTHFIPVDELANEWDAIVYTEHEQTITEALKIILPNYEHLVFVANERANAAGKPQRIAKVKLAGLPRPVPLKSLGDGMVRILQIAIKLVSAQGGFLLIDEFENGLHYSTQEKIWSWLFTMAERLDIQVFATTHNWDCIDSFAKVAIASTDTEGVLFRMGKSALKSNQGQIIATVFDKERLYNLTQADIELR
ncbi:AAA family ATPase [Methylovulum psychrotolerans]|uniref:AAA family ATPase n=1 Tax=Methylovulum psychrotolerans TaxID=1704499 RepID=UPI001BFF18B8|nr:ATP-binding protein [Methylovulum psychrotolerans]MBT9096257.1 AAA family ATPase [Methylovulum psychrotolerans]